mgnify:FL=1
MGGFLTIDKHVSNLEDLLELNPRVLSQTKFESHLPVEVTHHIKVPSLLMVRFGSSSRRTARVKQLM